MLKLGTLGFCLLLGLGGIASVQADDAPGIVLYRYVDSRGVTVLDRQGVPPEYVGKGYEVLNQRGRVVQTIPPAPSADELRDAQAANPTPMPTCCGCTAASKTSIGRRVVGSPNSTA